MPFTVKLVGAALVPLYVNCAPVVTAAPEAIFALKEALFTVMVFPAWDQVPLHPLPSFWLPV